MKILHLTGDAPEAEVMSLDLAKRAPHITRDIVTSIQDAFARLARPACDGYDLVLTHLNLADGGALALLAHVRSRMVPVAVVVLAEDNDAVAAVGPPTTAMQQVRTPSAVSARAWNVVWGLTRRSPSFCCLRG